MSPRLSFWAGEKAYAKIKEAGVCPDDVKVIAGAAGGPKWLILSQLDRAVFTAWLKPRTPPLFLIGSSIAAWRFAAISQKDPAAALKRFEAAYLEQSYAVNPPPAAISRELDKILARLMGKSGPVEILSHPFLRLNIMSVRCKGLTNTDRRSRLMPGLGLAAMSNALSRRALGLFFERTLFYDPRDIPPFFDMKGFPINRIPLTERNIESSLRASGSIPLLMPGVKDIPEAPDGMYRDGGIIDYHMNIPFMNEQDGIVLFPHYTESIVPGWLDKKIPWRKPDFSHMAHVLLIAPTQAVLDRLPGGTIPDRKDFDEYPGRDAERVGKWRQAIDLSAEMADEFMDVVETDRIRDRIQPIADLRYR